VKTPPGQCPKKCMHGCVCGRWSKKPEGPSREGPSRHVAVRRADLEALLAISRDEHAFGHLTSAEEKRVKAALGRNWRVKPEVR
jgi:hypothetical protein